MFQPLGTQEISLFLFYFLLVIVWRTLELIILHVRKMEFCIIKSPCVLNGFSIWSLGKRIYPTWHNKKLMLFHLFSLVSRNLFLLRFYNNGLQNGVVIINSSLLLFFLLTAKHLIFQIGMVPFTVCSTTYSIRGVYFNYQIPHPVVPAIEKGGLLAASLSRCLY